jgi:hypothetical protein
VERSQTFDVLGKVAKVQQASGVWSEGAAPVLGKDAKVLQSSGLSSESAAPDARDKAVMLADRCSARSHAFMAASWNYPPWHLALD